MPDDLKYVEKRRAQHVLDLIFEEAPKEGKARGLAASSIQVQTADSLLPGAPITFSLALDHLYPGLTVRLRYFGRILQVERQGGNVSLSVAIESHRVDTGEKAKG